jgi:dGTPase
VHARRMVASSTTCRVCARLTCSRNATLRLTGLNLCFETREGIVKHCSLANARRARRAGRALSCDRTQPSLEAQICNLADEIAYNNHDLDDGLRAGLITLEQLAEVSLFAQHVAEVRSAVSRGSAAGG